MPERIQLYDFFAAFILLFLFRLAPAAEPAKVETSPAGVAGPKYTRELKLWDTDPRDAAMIMAIVAETTQIPLKELQFLSIKEIKGDNQE